MIAIVWLATLPFAYPVSDNWVTLFREADSLQKLQRYREALIIYASALEAARSPGSGELAEGIVLNGAGYSYQQLGEVREATRHYAQALSVFEHFYPPADHHVIEVAMNLSNSYIASGELTRAESLLRRLLTAGTALRSQDKAALMEDLATLLIRRGKPDEAARIYRESLAAFENAGDEKERTVIALSNISVLSAQSDRLIEALQYNERARVVLETIKDPPPAIVIRTWTNAGAISARLGKYREAEEIFAKVISICGGTLGPENYLLGDVLIEYAHLLAQTGKKSEARRVNQRARSILNKFRTDNGIGLTIDAEALANSTARH